MAVYLFLSYLAAGLVVSTAVVRLGTEGRQFFLFNGALALAAGGAALVLRAIGPSGPGGLAPDRGAFFLAAAGLVLLALYLLTGAVAGERRWLLRVSAGLLILAVVADAHALHGAAAGRLPAASVLHALNAVGSAWLAGSILLAMILGHFYLVIPGLSIDPLRRLFRFSLLGLGARIALVTVTGLLWWSASGDGAISVAAFLGQGVFVLQRVLFGLLLPASLAWFTWKTIEMRSTQSATGILYVVVFLTLVGEALSVYLSLATAVPI